MQKDRMTEQHLEDESTSDESASQTERIAKPVSEKLMDLFEHEYYEVVVTNTSLAFICVLYGAHEASAAYHEVSILVVIAVQAVYLTIFFIEVALMVKFQDVTERKGLSEITNSACAQSERHF